MSLDKIKEIRTFSLGWLINSTGTRLDQEMKQRLEKIGLNLKEFGTLMILRENEGLTQVELSRRAGVPGYATTRTLDSLEKKGQIERRNIEGNRRAYHIFLTPKGQKVVKALPPIVREVNQQILSNLEASEQKELIRLLRKLGGLV